MELFVYDIQYIPRGNIKLQVLVDFLEELRSSASEKAPHIWGLSVDDISNLEGRCVRIVLDGPDNLLLEQSL